MEEIKQLIDQLNKYSFEYYTLNNPTISDKEYDLLYDKLVTLERGTGIILPNSPTQKVGGQILDGFDKVIHKNKLWSLDKANKFEEVKAFINKVDIFVNNYNKTHKDKLPKPNYVVTKKFDGLTVKCDYDNKGNFVKGSTRGTGEIGEDITSQAKTIINLPKQLNDNDKMCLSLSVHGEGLMTKKALSEYNKTAKTPLKNTRNGVAGALRNLNTTETSKRKCIIYFYNINDINNEIIKFDTYEQQLNYIEYRGLPTTDFVICNTYNEIINEIDKIEEGRPNLPYDIDGAVISVNDMRTRELLGFTSKFPNHSIAYKYEAEETTTKLIDIEWNTSRQGKIVPTAILEPVDLMGTTVKRATLNNLSDIERKGVKLNSRVFIRRSNDVIPEITGVSQEGLDLATDIICPSTCPNCGKPTEIRVSNKGIRTLHCTNNNCGLTKQISHYVSRNAMNIDGLSEKTIEKLIDLELLKSIQDIYYLSSDKAKAIIIKQDGFGIKSYNKLIQAIEKSKHCKLENFIFGLGIPNVGLSTAKNIVEYCEGATPLDTINNIMTTSINEWLNMKDCGKVVADSIYEWFHNTKNIEMIGYLAQMELEFESCLNLKPLDEGNILFGKKVYPTGKFSLNKSELKEQLQGLGVTIASGYSKSLDYLICGNDTSKSGKRDKAIKDNIKIMEEDTLMEILNFTQIK